MHHNDRAAALDGNRFVNRFRRSLHRAAVCNSEVFSSESTFAAGCGSISAAGAASAGHLQPCVRHGSWRRSSRAGIQQRVHMFAAGVASCPCAGAARCGPACAAGSAWLGPRASQPSAGSYSLHQGSLACHSSLVLHITMRVANQVTCCAGQAPAGSTLSAASAEQRVQAACTQASRLSSDVNAQVLTYDAAEAVQVPFCLRACKSHFCLLCLNSAGSWLQGVSCDTR